MKRQSVKAPANPGLGILILAAWFLSPREALLGRGYELVSASVQPAKGALAGGGYSMQAGVGPEKTVPASGGGYSIVAEAANLVVIQSVTLPTLRISWNDSGGIRIAWVDPTDRFILQATRSLGLDAKWITEGAVTHEGATAVFVGEGTASDGARFFRLQRK